MIGTLEFFSVLIVLYLIECAVKVRADATVFQAGLGRYYKLSSIRLLVGNGTWRWELLNPLRPDCAAFSCIPPPCWLSASGIQLPPSSGSEWRVLSFDELGEVRQEGSSLVCAGETRIDFGIPAAASAFIRRLKCVRKVSPQKREAWLATDLRSSLDRKVIREELNRLRAETLGVRRISVAIFALVLLVFPLAAVLAGLAVAVLGTGIAAVSLSIWLSFLYARLLHAYEPSLPKLEKYGTLLHLALYPLSGIRCLDRFSLPLLTSYDTVAVASVLGSPAEVESAVLHELGMLQEIAARQSNTPALASYTAAKMSALAEFTKALDIDLASLQKPPLPIDSNSRSYCPVCRVQYTIVEKACADCGVALRPLGSDETAQGD